MFIIFFSPNLLFTNQLTMKKLLVLITLILISISCVSEKKLIDKAKSDGRWTEFEECIDHHPSDYVCDSCWQAIIIKNK